VLFTRTPVAHRPRRGAERRGGGPEVGAINDISGSLVLARQIRSANSSLAAFLATKRDGEITSSKEAGAFSTHYTFLLISILLFLRRCLAPSPFLPPSLSLSLSLFPSAAAFLPRARSAYLQITLFSARSRPPPPLSLVCILSNGAIIMARVPWQFFERTAGF